MAMQVYCVNWNVVRRNTFLTGSWDDTIKLWDLNSPASLATFKEHTYCVYAATWWDFPCSVPLSGISHVRFCTPSHCLLCLSHE